MIARPDRLRILYVWDADYPWDVRTEKVCAALANAGVDVHIAARNRRCDPVEQRLDEGMVHRLRPWPVFNGASSFPAFVNPRWLAHLRALARSLQPHAIIVRDLPLSPTALWVARRQGIPVILDMAENYPAMIADLWITGTRGPFDMLLRNPALVRAVERYAVPRMDHVIVVVEESATRVTSSLGIPSDRLTIVSNTPSISRIRRHKTAAADGLTVVYLGLMEMARGVADLIRACALLRDSGTEVRLKLIGDGRDMAALRREAAALDLDERHVEFFGRLDHPAALAVVAASDIGIVPHHANESWNTTIPNKLFDYMAAGLPVVSSDAVPCVRVLQATGAGVTFRSGDAADLAAAIRQISPPAMRAALGENGIDAIRKEYNWETDSARLVSAITRVVAEYRPAIHGVQPSPEPHLRGVAAATEHNTGSHGE